MIPSDDHDLEKLVSRVDFYESCVEQLKKDIPKYVAKFYDLEKAHKDFSKSLRVIGSSEPNQKLQNAIFLYASKQEQLSETVQSFNSCSKLSSTSLEEAKKLIISPIREVIADQKSFLIKSTKKSKPGDLKIGDTSFVGSTLPVHVKMFEKHRLRSATSLMASIVETELRYHCKAVEELSLVIALLKKVEEGG